MLQLDKLPNQLKNEEVILVLRRDFVIFFFIILRYLLLAILPIFAKIFIIDFIFPHIVDTDEGVAVLTLLAFGYYLYIWLFFYRAFLDYYLDVWIVTNQRILNIELEDLFNRTVAEQKLNRIQDITTEQKGFLPHFFNYGNVYIQTAGTIQRFVFEEVSNPNKVAHQIHKLIKWNKKAFPDDE